MKTIYIVLLVIVVLLLAMLIILASSGLTIVLLAQVINCNRSVTTSSGIYSQPGGFFISTIYLLNNCLKIIVGPYCSGDLIFEDNFDSLDLRRWENENSLGGGGVNLKLIIP